MPRDARVDVAVQVKGAAKIATDTYRRLPEKENAQMYDE